MPKTQAVDELTLEERLRLGDTVRTVLSRLRRNQKDLARVLRITQGQVSEKLNGGPWSLDDIVRTARVVGLESRDLLGPIGEIPWDRLRWTEPSTRPSGPDSRVRPIRKGGRLPRLDSNQQPAGYRPAHPRVLLVA